MATIAQIPSKQSQSNAGEAYITTTELAKICGVSRFTIINWAKQGKIKTIKTVGKHHRITMREGLAVFQSLHDRKTSKTQTKARVRCYDYPENKNKDCRNCLINKTKSPNCFLIARHFGKEKIGCSGDCSHCVYYAELFDKKKNVENVEAAKKRPDYGNVLLNTFSRSVGFVVKKIGKII